MNRKEQLKKMHYGELQHTKEYKHYLDNYIYSESKLCNEIEYILNKSYEDTQAPYSWDDVTNMYRLNKDEFLHQLEEEFKNLDDEEKKELYIEYEVESHKELMEVINNEDLEEWGEDAFNSGYSTVDPEDYKENSEIFQWFIMDERIIRELEERGCCTLDGKYWGRETFGQAIEIDGVIVQIFKEWYLELYILPFNLEE